MIRAFACAAVVILSHTACDRPASPPSPAPTATATLSPSSSSGKDVSTIHWVGKRRLAADTNAASVLTLLNLPESTKLAEQTLDKLALAPWRLLKGDPATNGAPTALLRPLLDDLVAEESHWTFYHPTNAGGGWSLAIRLPPDRASLWRTNLVAVFESLTGGKAENTATGFSLKSQYSVSFLLPDTNGLTALTVAKTGAQFPTPSVQQFTNWLSFSLDLAAINRAFAFGWSLPANCPRAEMHTTGDGVSVTTRGALNFATPPALKIEPWNIPTNLIHDPLTSFVACRAAQPLLESLPFWPKLGLGEVSAQFYLWSQVGLPFQTYFAAPVSDVSNRLAGLSSRLILANSWLATNGLGRFTNTSDGRLLWADLMIMEPWLNKNHQPGSDWLAGGFFGVIRTNRLAPGELLAQFQASPSIVYYDWEITEQRVTDWLYLGQFLRLALHQAQVPPESAAIKWLVAAGAQLGNCGTVIHYQAPAVLTFNRRSSLGLSAAELHILVDWMESPRFPIGAYSVIAPPEDLTRRTMQKMAAMQPSPATNAPGTNQPAPP